MAIRNINNIQNHEDFKNVENKYILESLANLGQRYGIKGDGVKNGTLSLYNFFHDKGIVNIDSINDKIIVLKKSQDIEDSYSLYLVNKDEISLPVSSVISLDDKSKEDFIESIDGADISIKYNSIHFKVTDSYYEYFCKQTFNTKNKVSYILERVNKNTNTLEYGLRIYRGHGIEAYKNLYLITELILQDSDTELYTLNIYSSIIDTSHFESSEDEDAYWLYNEGDGFLESIDIDSNRNSIISEYTINLRSGNINYNNIEFSGSNLNDFETYFPGIHTLLYNYTYDIKLLYTEAKEKYSTNTYGDVNSIYSQILISLFNKITELSSTGEAPTEIYIPLTLSDTDTPNTEYFGIRYMCNSNSENEIYFSTQDIQVKYVYETLDSDWFDLNINSSRDYIVVHTDKSDRVSFFNFEVKKDDDNPDLTVGINTSLKSTLPYIDENGFWVLNDVPTTIYARGKNAGNPNIIIVESRRDNVDGIKHTIIAGANKENILDKLSWEKSIAYIEPLEKINLDTLTFKTEYDYFILDTAIPNLDKIDERNKSEYLSLLENAIIINICDISCIEVNNNYSTNNINYKLDDLYNIYGTNGIITTIWRVNEETGLFDYIRKRENPIAAVDFNYISNINNLIQYVVKNTEPVHPDNYYFSYLVFDSTYSTLKNNTSETKTYIYPNIINKISSQYNVTNYNNDLNFTPKFNDLIIRSNNDKVIDSLNQSGNLRYFNTTYNTAGNDNANIVTNSLYVYYNENGQLSRYNEYIPNYNVPSLDLSEVLTRNETLVNRLNIISFDRFGTAYLSYIGTSFENDKNVFRLGTSNTNINMGTDTLIYSTERDKFETQNQISVEFDKIKMEGDTDIDKNLYVKNNIVSNGVIWNKVDSNLYTNEIISNTSYYTTVFTPSSRYIYEISDNISDSKTKSGIVRFVKEELLQTESSKLDTQTLLSYSVYKYSIDRNKLYTINTIYNSNINNVLLYFGDGIYIPALLDKIGLGSYVSINSDYTKISTSTIEITSNMDVVKHNNSPILLLSTATNLYPDKYIYTRRNYYDSTIEQNVDNQVQCITNFTYSIFTGNPLKITYYIGASRLHLNIEEIYSKDKIMSDERVKLEYFS